MRYSWKYTTALEPFQRLDLHITLDVGNSIMQNRSRNVCLRSSRLEARLARKG
jgi:hypothetical protein